MMQRAFYQRIITGVAFSLSLSMAGRGIYQACAQSKPQATQSPASASPMVPSPQQMTPTERATATRRRVTELFMSELGWEETRAQQAIENHRTPYHTPYARILHITPQEQETIYQIVISARARSDENRRQESIVNEELMQSESAGSPELIAQRGLLIKEHAQIVDDVFLRLQQQLEPETFEKLKSYLYSSYEAAGLIRTIPNKDQGSN